MIDTFRCRETERLYATGTSRRFAAIQRVAMRKLVMLDEAEALEDLATTGNGWRP
jgi:proteic killer suppression protein